MAYEFGQVEAGFFGLPDSQLQSVCPRGTSLQALKQQLHSGHLVLLTDTPELPLLQLQVNEYGERRWVLNPAAEQAVDAAAARAYISRVQQGVHTGAVYSGNPLSSSSFVPFREEDYQPEPVKPLPSELPPEPEYEYCLEVACPDAVLSRETGSHFALAATSHEGEITLGTPVKTAYGVRYTARCAYDEPKRLKVLAGNMPSGLALTEVAVYPSGSQVVNEAFIPVYPGLAFEGRLGLPATGYYYHIMQGRLIQEYRITDSRNGCFQATCSTHETLNAEGMANRRQSALLVWWKQRGQLVEGQYLLYLRQAITREQLDNLSEEMLTTHGVKLDIDALLAVRQEKELPRDSAEPAPPETHHRTHTVQTDSATGKRERWDSIACRYGLSAGELLALNPEYKPDPLSLRAGQQLVVSKPAQTRQVTIPDNFPPCAPQLCNHPANSWYDYTAPTLPGADLLSLKQATMLSLSIPLLRLQTLPPQKVLRIGVFFDGTAQNNDNDKYKEERGNKSRTNIARLFAAYPEKEGESYAIYVSGVGTVDGAHTRPQLIDEGLDETNVAQGLAVELKDAFHEPSVYLSGTARIVTGAILAQLQEKTTAFYKWQNLLKQLADIINSLSKANLYQYITHIEFDVFGFSRGAALARHFINAAAIGLPDYTRPRSSPDTLSLQPNLFGTEQAERYNSMRGYHIDNLRQARIRFVGLFDTVGSFYMPGNDDEGNFELGLKPGCAAQVVQLSAHHEYREKFPLTALARGNTLPPDFYQEVFPGAHSDVGGGYPAQAQYNKQGLPARYGMPVSSTYNLQLVKTVSLAVDAARMHRSGIKGYNESYVIHRTRSEEIDWRPQCLREYGQYGIVRADKATLYYYRLQPVSNALAGLAQQRMKYLAEQAGVVWNMDDYTLPEDFKQDAPIQALLQQLQQQPAGTITPEHWQQVIEPRTESHIHRPHDALINPGCSSMRESLVNGPSYNRQQQLERQVYDNP